MLGRQVRGQDELLLAGSLRQLIPDGHILVRVDRVLDLGWLREVVADCYAAGSGRPGIDPEAAMRLMLAGLLLGITQDRRLLREAQVNLAIRWFAGYGLMERLPDHSSLTRLRQRWGAERFGQVLARTVRSCLAAGIAKGEMVHLDSSLIRADVSRDAIARERADASRPADGRPAGRVIATRCTSDPDATLATSSRHRPSQPSYKQHTAADAARGVVLHVEVTTGAVHDTQPVPHQLAAIAATTGATPAIATMDAGYATTRVFAALEAAGIEAIVPTRAEQPPRRGTIPVRRFKLDARNRRARCPAGRTLRRTASRMMRGSRPIVPASPIVSPARCGRAASARPCDGVPSCCTRTTPPCCGPVASTPDGANASSASTPATAPASKVSMARQRPGTASPICRSRPSSPPPSSTSSASPPPSGSRSSPQSLTHRDRHARTNSSQQGTFFNRPQPYD